MVASQVVPPVPSPLRPQIAEALRGNETQKQIADRLGCSVRLVAKVAEELELQRQRGRQPYSDNKAEARRLRGQGLTLTAIGAELGITRQAVSKLLRNT